MLELAGLIEAVSEFGGRAAEKLQLQQNVTGAVQVFIRASPFRKDDRRYGGSVTVPLVRPTADTAALVSSAIAGLRAMFKPGYRYAKTGVMLVELQPAELSQGSLDPGEPSEPDEPRSDRGRLMAAVDSVNQRYGRGAIGPASAGLAGDCRGFSMRQERRTPGYTTDWLDMPIARG